MMPGVSPKTTLGLVLVSAAVSLAAVAAALGIMEIAPLSTPEAARANLAALWPFWITSACGWASLTALWYRLRRPPAPTSTGHDPRRAAAVVFGVAALARVAVLVTHQPALSDDIYRYVFDGRNLASGVNPYTVKPEDRVDAAPRWPGEPEIVDRMNNRELHTIYMPTAQWVFGATGLVIPESWSSPAAGARVFRTVLTVIELAAIALMLVALMGAARSPWWATLYAWHPLTLTEIAGSGHQESLGIVLLVGAIYLGTHAPARTWRWTVPLALASLVKPVVLPVAALVLKGQNWRVWARSVIIGAAVCAAIAAPLWLTGDGEPLVNIMATAERFRLKWAHFGGIYEPLLWAAEHLRPAWTNDQQEILARRICVALLAAVFVAVWLRGPTGVWARARCILMAMVLLSPAAHPWYLLWALAMVPMAPGAATWVASLTLPWGYAAWGHVTAEGTAEWGVSPWLMVAAYLPVYTALALSGKTAQG